MAVGVTVDAGIAEVAALFADPARAAALGVLMSGRAHTAGELARAAGVSPPTMTSHLKKLREAGAVSLERQGRHRYFRLADGRLAEVFEALSNIAPSAPVRSLRQSTLSERLRDARSCYDHLAGRLGVAVTDALVGGDYLERDDGSYRVTVAGAEFFEELGIAVEDCRRQRRRFAFPCLDWTERTHHLAGALGAALLSMYRERDWVRPVPGSRAVTLTAAGSRELIGRLRLE